MCPYDFIITKGLIFIMDRVKKWGLIICIISLIVSAVGCDMVKVDPDKDRKRVIAKVDDTEILKGEFLDIYNQSKGMYGITDETEKDPEYEETVKQLKDIILDQLVTEKLIYNKAAEAGFEVNDQIIEETREQIMAELEESFSQDEEVSEEDAKELVRDQLDEYIEMSGMTEDEFWKMIAEQDQVDKFIEKQLEDVAITDEDVTKFYEEQLQEQKADPDVALGAQVKLHIPEGYRRVKHILIELPEDDREEHSKLLADEKEKEADEFLKEKLDEIESEAEEILERAKGGEDFEKLIGEYNADTGMDIEDGYTISQETNFVQSFKDAAFSLKAEGDISELVPSEFGYHIIKLYDLPGKDYTLEEKRDLIEKFVEYEQKNQKWASILEEWEEQAEIKKYEKRL